MKKIKHLLLSTVIVAGSLLHQVCASSYLDVLEHDWYKVAVDYVSEQGLMSAATAGHFLPDHPISRGDFVSILGRLEQIDSQQYPSSGFAQVSNDDPQSPYIAWAVETGIVNGYADGSFGQNDPITREQMAVMLDNYLQYFAYSVVFREKETPFNDMEGISPWALTGAENMQSIGMMTGDELGNFNPGQHVTRGETAAMVLRLCHELDLVAEFLGTYVGTYTSGEGEHGMMLEIVKNGSQYYANFSFFSETNQYKNAEAQFVQNIYRGEGDNFNFRGSYWTQQGQQSTLLDLIGAQEGDVISGTVLNLDGEQSFTVKKPLG